MISDRIASEYYSFLKEFGRAPNKLLITKGLEFSLLQELNDMIQYGVNPPDAKKLFEFYGMKIENIFKVGPLDRFEVCLVRVPE